MPILRYIPGRFDQKYQLKQKIQYLDDPCKRIWLGKPILKSLLFGGYGVDPNAAYESFIFFHMACGLSGTRLFYHLLLDFEPGLVDPLQVREIGIEECRYLQRLGAMYVWGVHCTKRGAPHPHMHVVINSRLPLRGKKLQIKKRNIVEHKLWANQVLNRFGLPLIDMHVPYNWKEENNE